MRSAGPGDDQARFLADLRVLRDAAAIGYDELAARAHYPSDILKEAENGPYLPTLPILAAYVRACEGDVLEWEERWRRVANEASGDPGLPVRAAGASPAAVAGARAGVGVVPPDAYDPERIKAALRGGGSQRSDQLGGYQSSAPGTTAQAARDNGSGGTGWSFTDVGSTGWNTTQAASGWGAAGMALDSAEAPSAEAPSAGWDAVDVGPGLSATEETPAAGWTTATDAPAAGWGAANGATESRGTRDAGGVDSAGWAAGPGWDAVADQASASGNHEALVDGSFGAIDLEGQFGGSWSQDSELLADRQGSIAPWSGPPETDLEPWSPGAEVVTPEPASGELAWPELPDTELMQSADADRLAHPDPSGDELGWAEVPTTAEPAAWNGADQALSPEPAVSGQAQVASARLQTVALEERPADRLYPLRLLVIIVIAALIGSGLVLLFK